MTHFIAESVFWCAIISLVVLVYQAAVLPGIRLGLRYRTFALRDRLRQLAINGTIKEASQAFLLLHQNLNSMCVSLSRYDLARVLHTVKTLDGEAREKAASRRAVMEAAPAEVRQIYEESMHVFATAVVVNSLFVFLIVGLCVAAGMLVRVGILKLKDALIKKVEDDTSLVFFSPEAAAV